MKDNLKAAIRQARLPRNSTCTKKISHAKAQSAAAFPVVSLRLLRLCRKKIVLDRSMPDLIVWIWHVRLGPQPHLLNQLTRISDAKTREAPAVISSPLFSSVHIDRAKIKAHTAQAIRAADHLQNFIRPKRHGYHWLQAQFGLQRRV